MREFLGLKHASKKGSRYRGRAQAVLGSGFFHFSHVDIWVRPDMIRDLQDKHPLFGKPRDEILMLRCRVQCRTIAMRDPEHQQPKKR